MGTIAHVFGGGMTYLFLIPVALGMGAIGLAAFLWSLKSGQYEDLDGAAERILMEASSDRPLHDYRIAPEVPWNEHDKNK
jgi:cbb3-type cytochrome oxidase maturation protein